MSAAARENADLVLAMYTVRKPVKRLSLRTVNVSATLAALALAMLAQPALAHLDVRPTLVEQGVLTDVRVELPQLRPGPPPRRLEVEGDGIEVVSADLQGTSGSDTVWNVRLRATAAPGAVPIVLRAVYGDGRSVEVDQQFTVAPGPETVGLPVGGRRGGRAPGGSRSRRSRSASPAAKPDSVTGRAVPAVRGRRPRLCVVSGRRRGSRRRRDRRPAVRDRAGAGGGGAARRQDRPDDRDAHARRPPLRARAACARARRADLDPPCGRGRVRLRPARRRRRDRARRGRPARDPHARTPSRAHLPRRDRPLARRRAVARPHRRLALRRRRRPPRPRGRRAGRRRGALPLAAAAARAAGRRRGLPRPRRRLALRQGDELEGLVDDRLRTPLQLRRSRSSTSPTSSPTRPPCRRRSRRT